MKALSTTFLFFIIFLSISCASNGQKFTYKPIPKKFLDRISVAQKEKDSIKNTFKNPYYLEEALPIGFTKNGTEDYTNYLQTAINKHREIVFPDFPVLVSEKGLTIPSNTRILFNNNSRIILKPNNWGQYEIIRIHDVKNVSIYFANIIGDKYRHTGSDGEWGMGISVRGTENVLLFAPIVKQCWGDGIYLGMSPVTNSVINESITIHKALVDDNRRNGMSIISGQNIRVDKFIAANTSGTPPHAGIDVEPDSNTDIIRNMTFDNVISFNNETHGFLFALGALSGKDNDLGVITIRNFIADTGYLGISLKLAHDKEFAIKPKGTINIINSKFQNLTRAEYLSYDENIRNTIIVNVKTGRYTDFIKVKEQLQNSDKFRIEK